MMNATSLPKDRVIIVADVGSNHNGDLDMAKALIAAAARAGADVVKFQTFRARTLCHPTGPNYKAIERYELPFEWHPELASYARQQGILWTSTPADFEALDLIAKLAPPFVKIGSDDLTNHPLIDRAVKTGLPVVLSCGMATEYEVAWALELMRHEWVWLLYCVSRYPAAAEDYGLRSLEWLTCALARNPLATLAGAGGKVGISDHTLSLALPALAVARGARMVEKHLTLSQLQYGPDHAHSLTAGEFALMVKGVREAEAVAKNLQILPLGEQGEMKRAARRGLYYADRFKAGHVLKAKDLHALRPAAAYGPDALARLVGYRLTHAVAPLAPVRPEDIRPPKCAS